MSDSYTIGAKLADTLFGDLFLARDERNGDAVAIKTSDRKMMSNGVCRRGFNVPEDPMEEIRIMNLLKNAGGHSNIVQLLNNFDQGAQHWQVLDYAAGGEFFDYLETVDTLSTSSARHYFLQAADAVAFMHRARVVHMDLSLENMLLTGDRSNLKICDFGLSREIPASALADSSYLLRSVGKTVYMAPEVYDPSVPLPASYDVRSVDVFSLGVCLFMMLTGYTPHEIPHVDKDIRFNLIVEQGFPALVRHYENHFGLAAVDSQAIDLLDRMVCLAPRRFTMEEVLAHPFLSTPNSFSKSEADPLHDLNTLVVDETKILALAEQSTSRDDSIQHQSGAMASLLNLNARTPTFTRSVIGSWCAFFVDKSKASLDSSSFEIISPVHEEEFSHSYEEDTDASDESIGDELMSNFLDVNLDSEEEGFYMGQSHSKCRYSGELRMSEYQWSS